MEIDDALERRADDTPSMRASADPRALRTREKLAAAFRAALAESDPAAMSVAALTRAAGVNRTSFYSHFTSPEDLAIHALGELFDAVSDTDILLRSAHAVAAAEASRRALHDIVHFVDQRRELYARVLGPGAAPRLLNAVTEAYTEQAVAALERAVARPASVDVRVTARFLAGGVLGVLGSWLADDQPAQSPDELVEALVNCLPDWLNTD